jgi:PST family polysaccharide transporter
LAEKNPGKASLTSRTLGGMFWSSLGAGSEVILKMVIMVILARLLDAKDFGMASLTTIIIGTGSLFVNVGLAPAVTQRRDLRAEHISTAMAATITLGLFLTLLLLALAGAISRFFAIPELRMYLSVASVAFVLIGISIVPRALLVRELAMRRVAITDVVSYFVSYGVIGVFLAWRGFGVWSLIFASVSGALIDTVLLFSMRPVIIRVNEIRRTAFADLFSFGAGATVARSASFAANQADNFVVGKLLGPIPLGYYSRAYQLMAAPATLFQNAAQQVMFSALARLQNEPDRFRAAFQRATALVALFVIPASVAVAVVGRNIIIVVLGDRWQGVVPVFQILVLGMYFRIAYKLSGSALSALGVMKRFAINQVIYALLVVVGASLGHFWGINGVAVGVTIAMTIQFITLSSIALKNIQMTWIEFISVQLPGIAWGFIALVVTSVVARVSTGMSLPVIVAGVTGPALSVVACAILAYFAPELMLGKHGQWAVSSARSRLRRGRQKPAEAAGVVT